MKIITDNKAYVQLNDMGCLINSNISIPSSIIMKVFGKGATIIDDRNRYEFIEFNEPGEIEFFKNLDWMIDYNSIKDLVEEEIIEMGKKIAEENNAIAQIYNAMTSEEQGNHEDLIFQSELLQFKMFSLRDVLWLKQGHISMKLPDEFVPDSRNDSPKGIKRLFKNFFNKKRQ